mmetsp:Transcript_18503/g.46554  ORF Transcript_18503/g.46554 Transcript_18503/m.46554 type:complete len:249 (+) Transcript_18503:469-1215(+)
MRHDVPPAGPSTSTPMKPKAPPKPKPEHGGDGSRSRSANTRGNSSGPTTSTSRSHSSERGGRRSLGGGATSSAHHSAAVSGAHKSGGGGGGSYAQMHAKEKELAYSKQPRNVDYTPYTLNDYQRMKPEKYFELGSLGPDLESNELREKKERQHMVKEFSKNLRKTNLQAIADAPPPRYQEPTPKEKSNREKALEFAARIPKPKVKRQDSGEFDEGRDEDEPLSELELLEERHAQAVDEVNRIRKELGL